MKKSIVTGGAGFIGSHLVDHLLKRGDPVVVLDDLSMGSLKNLEEARRSNQTVFHQADITDLEKIRPFFDGVDTVFHLAALADIVPSIEKPADYFRSNVDGTLNVMECAREAGVKRVIYAASSSCYGIPDRYPTNEQAEIRPQYPYALTKFLGEQTAIHWGLVYKMQVNSVRLFNVYGPRARTTDSYGAVFKVFLPQKIHGKPFTVVGDGKQTRDFTYVSDVVEALACVADSSLSGEIFNVGSGQTVSVNRLVQLLGGGTIVSVPKRPGEPDCTFADISKINGLLDWHPRVPIEKGIEHMLKSLDAWKDSPVWTAESIAHATRDWFRYLGK